MKNIITVVALLVIAVIGFSATNYSIKNAYGFEPAGLGPPMVFSGNVYVNGLAAPDGLNVTAWDSSVSSSQAVGSVLTSDGQYSNLLVCGQPSQNCNNGDTITFKLNNQLTANTTGTYSTGGTQTLNLHFTGTISQAQATTTTSAQTTPVQTTQSATLVTVVSTVTTPEYQDFAIISLAALLITLGIIAVRKQTTT